MAGHAPGASSRRTATRRPGLAVSAGLALVPLALAAPAFAETGPSFDCKAAQTKVERAICADPALAALDRRMAAAYHSAIGALDADAQFALRTDQRIYLETRDAQMETPDADLKASLTERTHMLERIAPTPRRDFAGLWSNAYGEITVRRRAAGGYDVTVSTVQPYPSYPVCNLDASGTVAGGVLVVGGRRDELRDNDGWSVRLTRKGAALIAELVPPRDTKGTAVGPPFCGFRPSIDGPFLPVRPAPAAR